MADISKYVVGVVLAMQTQDKKGSKPYKICSINVNDDASPITVVTVAPNVREGSRVVVAPIGSTVAADGWDELVVQATSVGGTMSHGMLCDSKMLGWAGGGAGVAVQIPDTMPVGSAPPKTKPGRPDSEADQAAEDAVPAAAPGLFEKKMTKEEKKKLAAEKRAAKKAAKEAKE